MITLINKKLANRKGFTLIELLVVLAVLAIIALIAIPNFLGVQAQSRAKADLETCNTIQDAIRIFLASENASITKDSTILVKGANGTTEASFTFTNIKDSTGTALADAKTKLEKYLDLKKVKFQTITEVTYFGDSNGNMSHKMKIDANGTKLTDK